MTTATIVEVRAKHGKVPTWVKFSDGTSASTFSDTLTKMALEFQGQNVEYRTEEVTTNDGNVYHNLTFLSRVTEALATVPTKPPAKVEEPHERREFENEFDMGTLLATASHLEMTEEQRTVLFAPVDRQAIEIRPDGLIYLPWVEYAGRLTRAFPGAWALVPQGMPKVRGNSIAWGFWLVIKGSLMGFAIGEQEYQPQNARMTYTDACEGAKSNALMRLCKGMGIGLELWQPSFVASWKVEHAEAYQERGRTYWRRKGARIRPPEEDAPPPPREEPPPARPSAPAIGKPPAFIIQLDKIEKELAAKIGEQRAHIEILQAMGACGYDSLADVVPKDRGKIIAEAYKVLAQHGVEGA